MAVSGKNGTVRVGGSAVTEVTKWTFEGSAQVHKYASNATSGHKGGVAGTKDCKGTVETKVGTDVLWTAGQAVTLVLQGPTSSDTITVNVIIATTPIEVDIDNGTPIGSTYAWEGVGPYAGAGIFAGID